MVYALQKFIHYLLGGCFKLFTDNSTLKYMVNKLVLEGKVCIWLFFFQEFSFEVIFKPGKSNVSPDHLSQLELGESGRVVDDHIHANLFIIQSIHNYLTDITLFLTTITMPEGYFVTQKRHLVVRTSYYQSIAS
jgi:hypothetical protein